MRPKGKTPWDFHDTIPPRGTGAFGMQEGQWEQNER
jgi:hypothetical protein